MSAAYDNYIAKKQAYEQVSKNAHDVLARFKAFAEPIIGGYPNIYINIPGQSVPMGMAQGRRAIDASNVPPPIDIHRAQVMQFNAQQEATEAWGRLSETERAELKPPQWLQTRR